MRESYPLPTIHEEWLGFIAVLIVTQDWRKMLLGKSAKYKTWKPVTGKVEEGDRPEYDSKHTVEQMMRNCCEREIKEETGLSDIHFQKMILLPGSLVYHKPPGDDVRPHAPQFFVGVLKDIYPPPIPNDEFERFEFWDIWDVANGYSAVNNCDRMNPVYAANHCAIFAKIAKDILDGHPDAKPFEATFPKGLCTPKFIALLEQAKTNLLKQYDAEMESRARMR